MALKYWFLSLVFCFSINYAFAQSNENSKSNAKVIEDSLKSKLRNLPAVVPLSPETDKKIEQIKIPVENDKDELNDFMFSKDCKKWKKMDMDKESTESDSQNVLFLRDKDRNVNALYDSSRIMFVGDLKNPIYTHVKEDAHYGIIGKRGLFYRSYEKKRASQGILGLLESLTLMAVEMSTGQWSVGRSKDGSTRLSLFLMSRPSGESSIVVACDTETQCQVYKSSIGKNVPLSDDAVTLEALNRQRFFSEGHREQFREACDYFESSKFRENFRKSIEDIRKSCSIDFRGRILNKAELDKVCFDLRKTLIPLFEKYHQSLKKK